MNSYKIQKHLIPYDENNVNNEQQINEEAERLLSGVIKKIAEDSASQYIRTMEKESRGIFNFKMSSGEKMKLTRELKRDLDRKEIKELIIDSIKKDIAKKQKEFDYAFNIT